MKLRNYLIIGIFLSVLVLTGCQPSISNSPSATFASSPTVIPAGNPSSSPVGSAVPATPEEFTVTDDIGRQVVIKGVPQRIISLAPSNTEIIYALGLEDKLAGVTTYCNYPEAAKSKPQVAEYDKIDAEKILSLQPDLVLADHLHKAEIVPALEKLGIPTVVIAPGTIDKVLEEIQLIGDITGKTHEAEALVSSLTQRANKVSSQISSLNPEKLRVLYVTWHDPIWTAGTNTMIDDLFNRVGVTNIAADQDGWVTLTLEEVVNRNPQVILVMSSMGVDTTSLDYINTEPRLQATEALQNHRVYPIDSDIFGRTTPRIIDGLETLAQILYPEIFP